MAEISISDPKWEDMVGEHNSAPHDNAVFLKWHSDYIVRFHELLKTVPAYEQPTPDSIAAWTEVPEDLKVEFEINGRTVKWIPVWDSLVKRLQNNIASFKSLDDLANEINPLHGFLHVAVGEVYKEPHIADPASAPRSTYFWQIHGLIDLWYRKGVAQSLS